MKYNFTDIIKYLFILLNIVIYLYFVLSMMKQNEDIITILTKSMYAMIMIYSFLFSFIKSLIF
jgi:hypothetical protein